MNTTETFAIVRVCIGLARAHADSLETSLTPSHCMSVSERRGGHLVSGATSRTEGQRSSFSALSDGQAARLSTSLSDGHCLRVRVARRGQPSSPKTVRRSMQWSKMAERSRWQPAIPDSRVTPRHASSASVWRCEIRASPDRSLTPWQPLRVQV